MKSVTIKLTSEQQKQIKDATGKSLKELDLDLPATGDLTEKELSQISGGVLKIVLTKPIGGKPTKYL